MMATIGFIFLFIILLWVTAVLGFAALFGGLDVGPIAVSDLKWFIPALCMVCWAWYGLFSHANISVVIS